MLRRSIGLALLLGALPAAGAERPLAQLSLEELMELEVTIVARRQQRLSETASAVTVLTGEDIRRSGARTLPDVLRLVPGVHVGRIDANTWAVTARGFGGRFANKLLVLIDGRSVYTPLFAGVFWDVQDLALEEVDRIEIVRGPGASVWGANAVNGVINIITRSSRELTGTTMRAGSGSGRQEASLAHGGAWGRQTTFRATGKWFDVDAGRSPSSTSAQDDQRMWRAGLRLDRRRDADIVMLQGAAYTGHSGETLVDAPVSLVPPYFGSLSTRADVSGGFALGRWRRTLSGGDAAILQAYVDRARRDDPADFSETRNTGDVELLYQRRVGARQDLVVGAGYRVTRDRLRPSFFLRADDDSRTDHLLSAFVHDEIRLRPDAVHLAVGMKVEHNSYTGLEAQPNARLLWTPHRRHALWVAASRAVRTPARFESGQSITVDLLTPGELLSSNDRVTRVAVENARPIRPDELLALEGGWRAQLRPDLLLDAAAFYNRYDDVLSLEFGRPYSVLDHEPPHNVLPLHFNNAMEGRLAGFELSAEARPAGWWRLRASYSFLDAELDNPDLRRERTAETGDPRRMITQWSSLDLPGTVRLDLIARHVSALPAFGVKAYTDADARLGWSPSPALELALSVRNLLDDERVEHHPGFESLLTTYEERAVFLHAAWRLPGAG